MDTRSRALLALGLVLLSVPIWAPFLDLTGTDYVYERTNVTIESDEVVMEDGVRLSTTEDQIACFGHVSDDRACRLERSLTRGNASAPSNVVHISGSARVAGPPFAVFGMSGQPYRRTVSYNETTGEYTLGLRPVDPQTALEEASYDASRRSGPIARTLDTGRAVSDDPLENARLYAHDGGYAVVYEAGISSSLSAKPMVERGFEAIFVGIGALFVFRAGRREGRFGRTR